MKLRVMAGTDVVASEPANPNMCCDEIAELLVPVIELLERHRLAKLENDRAIVEVARRTGRDRGGVAGYMNALKRRRRTAEFEPEHRSDLM